MSKKQKPVNVEVPKVEYSNMNLPPKPTNSDFECFGCSS